MFKVGDKVRVKQETLYSNEIVFFSREMSEYQGQEAIIREILEDDCYRLDIHPLWMWHKDWLDPVETFFIPYPEGSNNKKKYTLSIYIKGQAGSFQYSVDTKDQAMEHFAAITTTGYRRINDRGQFKWYSKDMIESITITGDDLQTKYPDTYVRT